MKLKYFIWQPVNTIVLIITIIMFIWWLVTAIQGNPNHNIAGFLGILVLFIAHKIMWIGMDIEEINRLHDEINTLKKLL